MKAEISHYGYLNQDSYSGIGLQQGVALTDRDLNALGDRLRAQIEALGKPTLDSGIPKGKGLLTEFNPNANPATSWSATFRESGGLVSCDGVLGRAFTVGDQSKFGFRNQKDLPNTSDIPNTESFYYADLFYDARTAFADPDLIDVGLHGAHTAYAVQKFVQIKQCREEDLIPTDCGLTMNPETMPSRGTWGFKIKLREPSSGPDSCDPCAELVSLEQSVESSLFRLEVHAVDYDDNGKPLSITLKWSSENGAMEFPVGSALDADYAYEYFTAATELNMGLPAGGYNHQPKHGKLVDGATGTAPSQATRLRRWDGFLELDLISGTLSGWDRNQPLFAGSGNSAHGLVDNDGNTLILNLHTLTVTLELEGRKILTGDFALALSREATADKIRALSDRPIGIQHHYCPLGYSDDGINFTKISPADKRRLNFPALNCIHAEDVSYDPGECEHAEGATNVQEALNAFCEVLDKANPKPKNPQVVGMDWGNGAAFLNDSQEAIGMMEHGLRVFFSEPLSNPTQSPLITQDVVTLHAESPHKRSFLGTIGNDQDVEAVCLQDFIISGVISTGMGKLNNQGDDSFYIKFVPNGRDVVQAVWEQWELANAHNEDDIIFPGPPEGTRFRLALNGRFLFSEEEKKPLDGFVPGRPISERIWAGFARGNVAGGGFLQNGIGHRNRIELDFDNTGLCHPSNFEAWFYLVCQNPVKPLVAVNTALAGALASLPQVAAGQTEAILAAQPNIGDARDLSRAIGADITDNDAFRTQVSFEGYQREGTSGGGTGAGPKDPARAKEGVLFRDVTKEQLMQVDGIGEKTAIKILEIRMRARIRRASDLVEAGVSKDIVERMKAVVKF